MIMSRVSYILISSMIFVYGFYPINMLAELSGYVGTGFSIFIRIVLIFMSCAAFFCLVPRLANRPFFAFISFVFFLFFIYFIRLFYDISFQFDSLGVDGDGLVKSYLSITIAPIFSFLIVLRYYEKHAFLYIISVLSVVAAITSFLLFDKYISSGGGYYGARLSTEKANPIALGSFFVSSIIITWSYLFTNQGRIGDIKKYTCLLLLLLYFTLVVLSGSRGALLSLLGVVTTYLFFNSKNRLISFLFISLFCFSVISIIVSFSSELFGDIDFFRGYLITGSQDDLSAMIRLGAYTNAISQFINNPVFGDLSLERTTLFYPHNIFVEILMSLGIVGGGAYILYIMLVFFMSIKLMKQQEGIGMILSLLWLQQLYALLFSGSIFQSYYFWAYGVSVGLIYLNPKFKEQLNMRS